MIVANLDRKHIQHSHSAMLISHSRYDWYDDRMAIDVETAVPLSTTFAANEQIRTRTLPGGLKATTVHLGDDLSIGMAHAALSLWMKDNLYQLIDAPRLVCL